jgi:peptidoglycan/LPS O-acetylase OafA/YrhL
MEEYHHTYGLPRFIAAGIPAFALVSSALILERIYGVAIKSRVIYLLGESSYILYLIHPYIVYTILRLAVPNADQLSPAAIAALICSLIAISVIIAIAIHEWFEKPIMAMLRARFAP